MSITTPSAEPNLVPGTVRTNLSYIVPICMTATLGGLLFGYDTGVISGAIEALTAKFGLTDFMKGFASSCVLIGCATGVLLVGPLSDRFGRKLAMFLAAIMFLVSGIGTSLPKDIWTFILFRFVGGVGIGIASISTPMYIAEITPAHIRGRMVAIVQITIAGGIAISAFVNYAIAHAHGDPSSAIAQDWMLNTGWRWMFAAGIMPSIVFFLLVFFIPESPRWLIEMGRDKEAESVLGKVAGQRFAASESANIRASLSQEKGTWAELFSPRLRLPLVVGVSLAVLQQVTGINAFMYFGVTIFKSMGARHGLDAGLLQQVIINGTGMLCTVIAIATVDKWGRKPLMLVGITGMGIALALMGFSAQFMSDPTSLGNWMLGFTLLYIACFGLSIGPIVWVILSEIYPTAIRGRAMGLATCCLWIADYAVTQSFPLLNADGSWFVRMFHHAFPFYVYAFFCVVMLLIVWRLTPETKGRSLEEIERFWSSK